MSDKIKGFNVVLKNSIDEESADKVRELFFLIDSVVAVEPIKSIYEDNMTAIKIKQEFKEKLLEFYRAI